jgi:hypothetical protein
VAPADEGYIGEKGEGIVLYLVGCGDIFGIVVCENNESNWKSTDYGNAIEVAKNEMDGG